MGKSQVVLVLQEALLVFKISLLRLHMPITVRSKGNVAGKELDMIPQEIYVLIEKKVNF